MKEMNDRTSCVNLVYLAIVELTKIRIYVQLPGWLMPQRGRPETIGYIVGA